MLNAKEMTAESETCKGVIATLRTPLCERDNHHDFDALQMFKHIILALENHLVQRGSRFSFLRTLFKGSRNMSGAS